MSNNEDLDYIETPRTAMVEKLIMGEELNAEDLKMGENLTNDLFKRKDFPSVNIGKTKTVTWLAYILWKMKRQENKKK